MIISRSWRTSALGWLIGAVLAAGCASAPPVTFYTLAPLPPEHPPARGTEFDATLSVGIGPVTLPEVLDRPQIVTRPNPQQVALDEYHRWGGSLKGDFPLVLAEDIAGRLGTDRISLYPWQKRDRPDLRVAVDVLRFDGRLGEAVELVALWSVTPDGDDDRSTAHRAAIRIPVSGGGYEAYVEAQSRAVAALAQAIARTVVDTAAPNTRRKD